MTKRPKPPPENDPVIDILSELKDVSPPSEARIAAAKEAYLKTAKRYRMEKAGTKTGSHGRFASIVENFLHIFTIK